jgi:hypothetical protein
MGNNGCAKFTEADWVLYAADTVPETGRKAMESHLLECVPCLEAYTAAIETQLAQQAGGQTASVAGTAPGTEDIMAYLTSVLPLPRGSQSVRPTFFRSTLAHYLIAASITLLLVGSGAFDWFTAGSQVFAAQQEAVSIASEWPQQWLTMARDWIGGWTHRD